VCVCVCVCLCARQHAVVQMRGGAPEKAKRSYRRRPPVRVTDLQQLSEMVREASCVIGAGRRRCCVVCVCC
jgi:hypothetical protein